MTAKVGLTTKVMKLLPDAIFVSLFGSLELPVRPDTKLVGLITVEADAWLCIIGFTKLTY